MGGNVDDVFQRRRRGHLLRRTTHWLDDKFAAAKGVVEDRTGVMHDSTAGKEVGR